MSDQATAVAPEPTIESRLAAALGGESKPEPAAAAIEQAAQPEQEAPVGEQDQASDEITADDLPDDDDTPQSVLDALEIEHNGQKHVLTRDKLKELAQKGFDYTAKTQQIAEERNRVQMMTAAIQQAAAVQAALVEDIGEYKALQRELSRFPQTPDQWMQASQNDPLGAFQQQTQYNALLQQLNAVGSQIQAKGAQLSQGQAAISTEQLRAEFAKVQERIPAWRDQESFKKDAAGIKSFLASEGFNEQEISSVVDARQLSAYYKAWKYDQLVKAKGEKLKQVRTAPPVVKPGSANTGNGADRNKTQELRQRLRKSGDVKDAAALLLQMERRR